MPKQNEKILVVDDDPETLDLAAEQVLKPLGYQVTTARDGTSALQIALRLVPDIMIVALELPGLSGRDLLAALRSRGFDNIVIATGAKGAEAALQAFRLGARDYLAKPLREAELVASLDRAMEELRLRKEREQLAQKLSAANQQLEKQVKELTTLYGIGKAVTAITDLGQLLARLLEGAIFVTEAESGWILLAEEGSGRMILRAAKNMPGVPGLKLNQPWDDGISPLLMMSGEGLTLAGEPLAKLRAGQMVKAAAAAPIKARDQVMGVIVVGNRSGKAFGERDQAMLSAVADHASIALVNVRLFQALEARARDLQKSCDELAHVSRAKDEIILHVGRELRTPLGQVKSGLEQLARWEMGTLSQQQTDTLHALLARLETMQILVEDMTLLCEGPGRPAHPRSVVLADLAKQAIIRLGAEAKQKGVTLKVDVPAETIKVAADAAQIGRVFDHLIGNAIKFSPPAGEVIVRLRDGGDGTIQTAVIDRGIGIPAEKLPLIWKPFYQAEGAPGRKFGGIGLGLAVVKQIVEAHGGKVWVESEPGRGSNLYFSLFKI